ncbi:MAG: hypothetical protein KJO25_08615, partial [Bacteroidia bacterium]|nr:hypothetical protein [Bacteroidia bacterium]
GLTQFDSGRYVIPRQRILIGGRPVLSDSFAIEISGIAVDTTKQKLYDIKPIILVDKGPSNWWKYLLIVLFLLAVAGFLLYWFVWRKKGMTLEEKIAILPPYERAKLALQELDKAQYLEQDEIKAFYSDLTLIIRKYLDEKVYDHSLESTTQELINRLTLLKDGNQIDFDQTTIRNIDTILKRADLVKFAKSKPDPELARLDLGTIDKEIDQVKEVLPEPTEEERLADEKYQEELLKKRKRKRIIIAGAIVLLLLIGSFVGSGLHFGFRYVMDSILGDPSKELLERKEWITSEYGAPGIIITTPEVLERQKPEIPAEFESKIQQVKFRFGTLESNFFITVSTTKINAEQDQMGGQQSDSDQQPAIDLRQAADAALNALEKEGVQNMITKNEQFITPNGQEGLKTFGTADFPVNDSGGYAQGKYVYLAFAAENILQQVVMAWKENDPYADEIADRILSSVELLKPEEEE